MEQQLNKPNWTAKIPQYLFIAAVVWFIIAFLIYPNFIVLKDIFWVDGSFSLTAIGKVIGSNRAMNSIKNSIVLAIVLTITVNIVGIFIVLVTEYFDIKGAKILRIAFMSTLVFGGLILNNGYIYVYGSNGVLTNFLVQFFPNMNIRWFTGFPAVLFVMTFACTSNHMLFLRNAVSGLDAGIIEAGRNLGSNQWDILRKIVLPSLKPVLITLVIMTFQMGLGAMSAPLMVGGTEFQTISPLILSFAQRPGSRDLAAVLSLLLGLAQILLLYVMTQNEKKGNFLSISKTKTRLTKQKIENPVLNIAVHILSYVLFVIYAAPVILVILFSFMDTQAISSKVLSFDSFTLTNYTNILADVTNYRPLFTSITFSAIAAIGSVVFMLLVARLIMTNRKSRLIESIEFGFYIPWLLPALLIAIGLILAYDTSHPLIFGLHTIGALWPLPVAYMIMKLPQTLRYIKGAYYSFDNNLEDASRNLGASPIRTFIQIILPALLPTALALLALNFNSSLADYDLSAFLYQPTHPTLGIVIRSNADSTTNVNAQAINLVYSVILMCISTVIFYLVYGRGTKLGERKGGIKR